jgi:hypothetical protein
VTHPHVHNLTRALIELVTANHRCRPRLDANLPIILNRFIQLEAARLSQLRNNPSPTLADQEDARQASKDIANYVINTFGLN